MNLFRQWPAALLSLAAFGAAVTAQEPTTPAGTAAKPPAPTAGTGEPETKPADSDMREDVEILRRLLQLGLAEADRMPGAQPNQIIYSTTYVTPEAHSAPLVEGVYLKGYGVVYTATLPPPPSDPVAGSKADARNKAPLDPWERTRMELHGQTPELEGKAAPAHPSLSEVILKVLAENGRHFGGLQDGERITVAVTFRVGANGVNYPPSATWQNQPLNYYLYHPPMPGGMPSPGASPPPVAAPPGGIINVPLPGSPPQEGGFGAPLRTTQATPEWLTDVRNEVLLGDLHLKQGKAQDAVSSYMNALKRAETGIRHEKDSGGKFAPGDLPAVLTSVELCNKLAQAYVATGNEEQARLMLRNASRLAKEAEKLTPAPANPKPAGSAALPAKLVVTAPKELLDDVGSVNMTFAAFCKAATVEYTGGAR